MEAMTLIVRICLVLAFVVMLGLTIKKRYFPKEIE